MIGTPWHNLVPVKVISSEMLDEESENGRWRYRVKVVEYGASVSTLPDVPTIPTGGPKELKAYNMFEYANTTSSHMGIDPSTLPGTFALQPIPDGTIVPAFIANGRLDDADATSGVMVMLLWPNQFDGDCSASLIDVALVQSFAGHWTSNTQYGGTVGVNTEQVIDLSVGAERHGANLIRLWNGAEALNAGASLVSGRYTFPTGAASRAWWNLYTVRVNVNNEGWQYLNASNSGSNTVDGTAGNATIATTPAVSWSGSDFAANLYMEMEVYKLSLGGGP